MVLVIPRSSNLVRAKEEPRKCRFRFDKINHHAVDRLVEQRDVAVVHEPALEPERRSLRRLHHRRAPAIEDAVRRAAPRPRVALA